MRARTDGRFAIARSGRAPGALLPVLVIALASGVSAGPWAEDGKALLEVVRQEKPVGLGGSRLAKQNLRRDLYEGFADRGSAGLLEPVFDSDSGRLGNFLTLSEPPSRLDSPYTKLTKSTDPFYGKASYESMLAREIVTSRGGLRPADVLKMSLRVCQNDYLLATLTAHNLLKESVYVLREKGQTAAVGTSSLMSRGIHVDPREINGKMANLRPPGDEFERDVLGPYYHAFGLLFLGAALSTPDAQFTAEVESVYRHLPRSNSPPDPTKEAVNSWAAGLSRDLNQALAGTPLQVTITGPNSAPLGDGVRLAGEVSFREPTPHRLLWRDEQGRTLGLGEREITFSPDEPGLHRVTLEVCDAGDSRVEVSAGSSHGVACPSLLASASHVVVVDRLGNVSGSIAGPLAAAVGETVELTARVVNHDRKNPMPELFYYWRVNDEKEVEARDDGRRFAYAVRDANPVKITLVIRQQFLGVMTKLAEATHVILPRAPPKIEGPKRTRVNGGAVPEVVVPPSPAPGPATTFDAQCALARWTADYLAKANHSGRDGDQTYAYRLEWTSPPRLVGGEVRGAFVKWLSKRHDDGRVIAPYVEVTVPDSALATLADLRRSYPGCGGSGSSGGGGGGADGTDALVAGWKGDFEKPTSGQEPTYSWRSRIEWTRAPFVENGVVRGAFRRMTEKSFVDGRRVDWYPEVEMFDADRPGVLITVEEIRRARHQATRER